MTVQHSVINQDLARWSRRHWFWAILVVAGLQFGALYYFGRPVYSRTVYPAETALELPTHDRARESTSADWLEVQNPMLFAAPNWRSVSALGWMNKPQLELVLPQEFPRIQLLAHSESRGLAADPPLDGRALVTVHHRPAPDITLPVGPMPSADRASRLIFDGFEGRAPVSQPTLPVQFHNDYVSRTVVEAGVDADGFVISTRLVGSSGSKTADADGMALARAVRFQPLPASLADSAEIVWGKLIFEWHALSLPPTDAVKR